MSGPGTGSRLRKFLAGPELGLLSTLVFAGLYTWPFLAIEGAGSVFRFVFVVWMLHIALLALVAIVGRDVEPGAEEENG